MTEVFVDTDILLDLISGRVPFGKEAASLFVMMDQEHIRGKASSLSFSNLYYVLRKYASHQRVINQLDSLEKLLEIQEVNGAMIRTALKSRFRDLEDAIQYQCAVSNPQISLIVSRNVKDYKYSELPVMSPRTFLASWYKSQG